MKTIMSTITVFFIVFMSFLSLAQTSSDENPLQLPNTAEEYAESVRPIMVSLYEKGQSVIFDIRGRKNEIILFAEDPLLNIVEDVSEKHNDYIWMEQLIAMCQQKGNLDTKL